MKNSIKVTPVMGSMCVYTRKKIATVLCEYPRTLHAELLTHRVFSKNSASTRAIPTKKAIQNANENPAIYQWTSNKSGMAGNRITDEEVLTKAELLYQTGLKTISEIVAALGLPESEGGLNIHKQHACRLLEPFSNIRIVLTSTEWENFDWLRIDPMAFPEIEILATKVKEARESLEYVPLTHGQWHVPFVTRKFRSEHGKPEIQYFHPVTNAELSIDAAKELSMSLCAQTSFRNNDASDEKTGSVIDKLFGGNKVHASPSEHQATPFDPNLYDMVTKVPVTSISASQYKGLTGVKLDGSLSSGNFINWVQNRQLIPNHDKALF